MQSRSFHIRDARPEDAAASTLVLRESISQLCVEDHENDPGRLSRWSANKTTNTFLKWLQEPNLVMRVAARGNEIIGVGSCDTTLRKIVLLYVSPSYRFAGVSAALLNDLEETLKSRGSEQMSLETTSTALHFYKSRGWRSVGEEGMRTMLVKQ